MWTSLPDKPVLVFDGDCGFCRHWVNRWRHLTGDRVEYLPSQQFSSPEPRYDFSASIYLFEPGGRVSRGAEAAFRTLRYGGHPAALWFYEHVPAFAPASEFIYSVIAGHRPAFSALTRWLWGAGETIATYRQARWLFLRALAVVYGIAFASWGVQVRSLVGAEGILPAVAFLERLTPYGWSRFWHVPTLAWVNASDAFLVGLCAAGVVFSIILFLNVAPRAALAALWMLYLSIVSTGGEFMSFQWDALLLETGFLAIFFAPPGLLPQRRGARSPARPFVYLLHWLLFRLMVQSAIVKWASGDALWRNLTALTVHYQTQPIPNPVAWYAHQLPLWFQKLSCAGMFVIEGFIPFLIFSGRRPRMVAFFALAGLQVLIFLSGNYCFFNLLALALCLLLLDDASLRQILPGGWQEPSPESGPKSKVQSLWTLGLRLGTAVIFLLTLMPFGYTLGLRWPAPVGEAASWLAPLRSFNGYGLFAVMTPTRPEIVLEGSRDGNEWKAYEFKYKPGDLARRPPQVAPHQPRLDWQMWFAALSDYRQNPWFLRVCEILLTRRAAGPLGPLLGRNPFPYDPPHYLRASVYEYRFTTPEERRRSGHWWRREHNGLYCPVMSLRESR